MPKWFKRIQSILEKEPETWLAYLDGQQLENIPHLRRLKPRVRGSFLRVSVFFFRMFQAIQFKNKPNTKRFLVYADSANQQSALEDTLIAFHRHECEVTSLIKYQNFDDSAKIQGYQPLSFSPLDVLKTAILLIARFNFLRKELVTTDKFLLTHKLDTFCSVYAHLAYFERLLRHQRPHFIIVSNDHNVANRALLAIADDHEIDTVYMQHASVSSLFPAINVKYAFLDGEAAAQTYQQCEPNHPPGKALRTDRHIFLSGQKKKLAARPKPEIYSVGVALNALDNPRDIDAFLTEIKSKGISAKIRWHPGLKDRALKPLLDLMTKHGNVAKSDPREETVGDFLGSVKALVAGNSSIHLEAALSGTVPVYYEFTPADNPDYYGYVKQGVSKQATTVEELARFLKRIDDGNATINTQAVQHFSATYGTEWEGREGEFVVQQLLAQKQSKKDRDVSQAPTNCPTT
ncbi:hypothetical protein [Salicola sp. Rm-C-2C1-2]|uniref:hypothetical protein n=1 Tax=Salicola sp. Rm-C-2C1-2 TaxID=3141321 RepID=UPI0032E453C1